MPLGRLSAILDSRQSLLIRSLRRSKQSLQTDGFRTPSSDLQNFFKKLREIDKFRHIIYGGRKWQKGEVRSSAEQTLCRRSGRPHLSLRFRVLISKDAAEQPVDDLCQSGPYAADRTISLNTLGTSRTLGPEAYLSQSGACSEAVLRFEADTLDQQEQTIEAYAEIPGFLNSIREPECNILLQVPANKTDISHRETHIPDDFDPSAYAIEFLSAGIEVDMRMGYPR